MEQPASQTAAPTARARKFPWIDFLLPVVLGSALAAIFWTPLLGGAGFVGGDVYNYFFPLKHFYAEGLQAGELRLWHPGIGNGVPVLGESQTGMLYPANLVLYRFLDLNTAYNASFLLHYLLAFVFSYWLAGYVGLGRFGSTAAAVVFVYGWFPPRACLEWAIVTGTWMPLSLLFALRWMDEGRSIFAAGLALSTAIQLLAGHFQVAFVTIVALGLTTAGWRPRQWRTRAGLARRLLVPAAILLGFALAGPQLAPAWELKVRSQRSQEAFARSVAFGNVPAGYLIQWAAPFWVYPAAESVLRELGPATNKVEAHLYFSVVGLMLALGLVVTGRARGDLVPWVAFAAVGVLLAEGTLFEWLRRVPGFSFFRYPGRYGLLAQLGVAMLAGAALDRIAPRTPWLRASARALLLAAIVADLYWVSRQVQYVAMVHPPVIGKLDRSEVFRRLERTDRVLAIDGNTVALSGAACAPPYLGMGPAEYYEVWGNLPDCFHGKTGPEPEVLATLARMGVSHLLTEEPLPGGWPATLVWSGFDPFLHPRWGRSPSEPLYLYSFDGSLGRAYAATASGEPLPGARCEVVKLAAHRVVVECDLPSPARVVLTDLAFPGWSAAVDGEPAAARREGFFRAVDVPEGRHSIVWTYRPTSVRRGAGFSLLGLAALGAWLWFFPGRKEAVSTLSQRSAEGG